jgi:hypothetical protein
VDVCATDKERPGRVAPKLSRYKDAIEAMLREDVTASRKQRHTATSI